MSYLIIFLSLVQGVLGGLLLFHTLRISQPDSFKCRLALYVFAAIGSASLTSAVCYIYDFSLLRSLLAIVLSSFSLWFLSLINWKLQGFCFSQVIKILKGGSI